MARSADRASAVLRPEEEDAGGPRLDLLYREQAPRLRRRLRAQLRSPEEAHDLVQDAFVRLVGATARQALREPEAFLNQIIRNLLIDRGRRLAKHAVHMPVEEDTLATVAPSQCEAIELAQMRDSYRTAVNALPARMREVFLLHRIEELSYKDIALQLGISVRTVEWHFAEAIVRIGKGIER